jgi:hypothetical protein
LPLVEQDVASDFIWHEKLKVELSTHQVRVVALNPPKSWMMAKANSDDFTTRMFDAINGMMLDMLAAVARKDYDDRRRRQAQGQARARAKGSTRDVWKTSLVTTASQPCCGLDRPGHRFKLRPAVAGRLLRRSPNAVKLGRAQAIEHSLRETPGPGLLQIMPHP